MFAHVSHSHWHGLRAVATRVVKQRRLQQYTAAVSCQLWAHARGGPGTHVYGHEAFGAFLQRLGPKLSRAGMCMGEAGVYLASALARFRRCACAA